MQRQNRPVCHTCQGLGRHPFHFEQGCRYAAIAASQQTQNQQLTQAALHALGLPAQAAVPMAVVVNNQAGAAVGKQAVWCCHCSKKTKSHTSDSCMHAVPCRHCKLTNHLSKDCRKKQQVHQVQQMQLPVLPPTILMGAPAFMGPQTVVRVKMNRPCCCGPQNQCTFQTQNGIMYCGTCRHYVQ